MLPGDDGSNDNHAYIPLKMIPGKERGSRRKGSLAFCLWSSPLLSMVCRRACRQVWNRACHPASGQVVPEADLETVAFRPVCNQACHPVSDQVVLEADSVAEASGQVVPEADSVAEASGLVCRLV